MAVTVEEVLAERRDVVSGIFKIKDRVPVVHLVAFANNWLQRQPDRLLSVSVRGCAKDMNGIDFRYVFEGDDYNSDMYRISRWLRETLGDHNVRGWSVSSPTYIIK